MEPATDTPEAQSAAPVPAGDTSTHFIFAHKIFSIPNCRFAWNGTDKMPCFYIPMGDQVAAIELAKLQHEFSLPNDSPDVALLRMVGKGLNYVREIRPNDSIPREILDGSASWSVEDKHRLMARVRLNQELINWITGFSEDGLTLDVMQTQQAEPEGQARLRDAHQKLAQLLGLPDAKAAEDKAAALVRETTYIEALRDRCGKLVDIANKLAAFASAFRKESALMAEILRMQDLMRRAQRQIGERFQEIDNLVHEVNKALGNPAQTTIQVRNTRDNVHMELKKWDDHFIRWDNLKVERTEETDKLFRKFYQFLAENYMETQQWKLTHAGR